MYTIFTGLQPCSEEANGVYSCWDLSGGTESQDTEQETFTWLTVDHLQDRKYAR